MGEAKRKRMAAAVDNPVKRALDALPRWGGLPVPYTVMWSSEKEAAIEVAANPFSARAGLEYQYLAIERQSQGIGHPIFSVQNTSRMNLCNLGELCAVCGTVLTPKDWYWFESCTYTKDRHLLVIDHPVHKVCGDFAMGNCPHLKAGYKPLRKFPGHSLVGAGILSIEEFSVDNPSVDVSGLDDTASIVTDTGLHFPLPCLELLRHAVNIVETGGKLAPSLVEYVHDSACAQEDTREKATATFLCQWTIAKGKAEEEGRPFKFPRFRDLDHIVLRGERGSRVVML